MEYLKRATPAPEAITQSVRDTVSEILLAVEREGERAVRRYSAKLDGWSPESFRVDTVPQIDATLRDHIDDALAQVQGFARAQRATLTDLEVETLPGVTLGHRHVPVNAVGSYSPGGKYPLIGSSI